jgi:hypothetical protein
LNFLWKLIDLLTTEKLLSMTLKMKLGCWKFHLKLIDESLKSQIINKK